MMASPLFTLVTMLLLAGAAQAQQRFVLGAEGVSWQSGGQHRDPTVLFKLKGRSVREDTTNTPGDAIDFAHRPGWISPLFFDPDDNISARVLERDGLIFISGAFYGAREAEQLRGTVNGDHSVAFERRPSLEEATPKIRDVSVRLDFAVAVGIHRVRFYPRNTVVEAPFFPFQEDYLRSYELWVNPTETDLNTPDRLVRRNTTNEESVVDIEMAPQYVRFVKLRSLTTVPFELDEIEVYGTGYMAQGTYLSDIIDLGDRASIGPLRWLQAIVGDSLFSQLNVRVRTGTDDTPMVYQQWVRDSAGAPTGSTQVTPEEYYALERRDRAPLGEEDLTNWSPWATVENGELSTVPIPRRYAQLRLDFAGGLFNTHTVERIEFEYLVPPIADELLAEVYPRLAQAEEPATFRYAVRLGSRGEIRGFDRLEIDTNIAVTSVRELKVNGRPVDFELEDVRADAFALRFPLVQEDDTVLEFTFDLPIFRFGTTFSGRAYNTQAGSVAQLLQAGDAIEFAPDDHATLSGLFVAIPKAQLGKLVGEIAVSGRIITPNTDGINDAFSLSFNLLQLLKPAPVALEIFDLSGRRLHQTCTDERGIGPAACSWDGRLANGKLALPGTYIWVLQVEADAFKEKHMGTIAVAY
ncbi:MAG: T9SS type B sorting domain-containing protein [Candidatus Latescibacterota bacterium]|jgi:hypothetical protein